MEFMMSRLKKMVIRVTRIKAIMIKKENKISIQLMNKNNQRTKKICLRLLLLISK
jgi:hypothetical protein